MTRRQYYVNWNDAPYPEICVWSANASRYFDPMPLAEAKQEIVDHFQSLIDHAREQIKQARAVRAGDFTNPEEN